MYPCFFFPWASAPLRCYRTPKAARHRFSPVCVGATATHPGTSACPLLPGQSHLQQHSLRLSWTISRKPHLACFAFSNPYAPPVWMLINNMHLKAQPRGLALHTGPQPRHVVSGFLVSELPAPQQARWGPVHACQSAYLIETIYNC